MKNLVLSAATLSMLTFASATMSSVSFDQTYDKGSNSLGITACSNGANGLQTAGFTTFSSLPTFPFIGGAGAVTGWNSTGCGTCWKLTFTSGKINSTITVTAVDVAAAGTFNIGEDAMNNLTSGNAVELGRVSVTSQQLAASACGL
jgi:hypothetical protein